MRDPLRRTLSTLSRHLKINRQISAKELRIIGAEGENLGVLPLAEALARAEALGLDLIEISPMAIPPVGKIMEYGKYQYLENKKDKGPKTKSAGSELKSLQVKIGTGTHDLELKARQASAFLKEGHRVKINLFLPGRAKYLDKDFLKERLDRLLNLLTEDYKIASAPEKSPKGMSTIIERAK
ncbi:MAG: translation initiation factor IF-3 [Candidatus Pacebacteria bacterium]|nr:translation initiation factor IF-3 [Candidatus Paceibacterota bacterium]